MTEKVLNQMGEGWKKVWIKTIDLVEEKFSFDKDMNSTMTYKKNNNEPFELLVESYKKRKKDNDFDLFCKLLHWNGLKIDLFFTETSLNVDLLISIKLIMN
jgi:hypothetical protein